MKIAVKKPIDVQIVIPVRKTSHTARMKATAPISVGNGYFSLPMQDALRRLNPLFDDDEGYRDWIRRYHPENHEEY